MSSEENLIEQVRRKFRSRAGGLLTGTGPTGLRVGMGDDAAVLRPSAGTEWVVTTDAFLENVHFLQDAHPAMAVGFKALARATSDLAAMGARPRYFLMGLAISESCATKWLDDFLAGMAQAARRFGLVLVGGDTTKDASVMVNLTVIGEVGHGRAVLRSGAGAGDLICVSGRLGEAEFGWQLVRRGLHKSNRWKEFLHKHFCPQPRLALGQWLVKQRCATAMIDTSDGLSTDLGHICKASGVGAKVFAEKIPLVNVPPELRRLGLDPLRLAVDGGEDYELLFTVPKRLAGHLPRKVKGVPITIIGEITREKKIKLVGPSGQSAPLRPRGWDPFRKKS
jgi:thiamine-monophosphate kinase